jgi:hypothetical protein
VYDGEAFIVVPGLGEYNILNSLGTRVWELIDGERTVQEIARIIEGEYEGSLEQIEADVREFVEDLKKHQMVS